jgi:hypothetical protein
VLLIHLYTEVRMSTPRLRRHLLALPLAFAGACASFAALRSETFIEGGQAFKLGGGQRGAFSVVGRNSGSQPVIVYVEQGGRRASLTTLAPGAPIDAQFPPGAMAIFRNTSSTAGARVAIKVTGDISSLGMRYEANPR